VTFGDDNQRAMRRRIATWALVGLFAVNGAALAVGPAAGLPRGLGNYFFGPKLVRADVVVRDGGIREFRLDRGRLLRKQGASLMVREADGTVVVVRVAPGATILLNGRAAVLAELTNGMTVTTVREGGAAASEIRARTRLFR
jgi:hypothetical protein